MSTDPLDLMRSAALDALERLHAVSWHRDIESFYAPLGETLVWLNALADALGKRHEPEYSGLAHARNCVVHGVVIVSQVAGQEPGQRSPLKGDVHRHVPGQAVQIWGFTEDPQPHDPTTGRGC